MDGSILLLLLGAFSLIFFLIQRTEKRRRLAVALLMLLPLVLLQRYANFREAHTEALIAFTLALLVNLFYWLLIGRYNPVPSSDEIRVIRMDD